MKKKLMTLGGGLVLLVVLGAPTQCMGGCEQACLNTCYAEFDFCEEDPEVDPGICRTNLYVCERGCDQQCDSEV